MADNNYTIPSEPLTREEEYLDAIVTNTASGGGGGKYVVDELTVTQNGTYTGTGGVNAYNPVNVNVANSYTAQDEGKVVSRGELVAQTAYPSTVTTNGTINTTTNNSVTIDVPEKTNWLNSPIGNCKPTCSKWMDAKYWIPKTWNGLTDFNGYRVWTDGTDIYYSTGSTYQYVLNKSTSTWETKTWNGYDDILGEEIWSDGENIYYSYNTKQYVLNKATSTWSPKGWSGTYGSMIWSDGENIYSSYDTRQYVFDKATSTWSTKTWTGLTSFSGEDVWTDGTNIYLSMGSYQYVLNKATSTWETKTWTGLTNFNGYNVWTDGINIYYVDGQSTRYMLNKETSTWSTRVWAGFTNFSGKGIWTDGENIYYSGGTNQYVLSTITLNNSSVPAPSTRCITSN